MVRPTGGRRVANAWTSLVLALFVLISVCAPVASASTGASRGPVRNVQASLRRPAPSAQATSSITCLPAPPPSIQPSPTPVTTPAPGGALAPAPNQMPDPNVVS